MTIDHTPKTDFNALFAQCIAEHHERYRRRAGVEAPYELRRHPENTRSFSEIA